MKTYVWMEINLPVEHYNRYQKKELANAALTCKFIAEDQLRAASFFLSGKPNAAASLTS